MFNDIGHVVIVTNGQIWKKNIAIWSHWKWHTFWITSSIGLPTYHKSATAWMGQFLQFKLTQFSKSFNEIDAIIYLVRDVRAKNILPMDTGTLHFGACWGRIAYSVLLLLQKVNNNWIIVQLIPLPTPNCVWTVPYILVKKRWNPTAVSIFSKLTDSKIHGFVVFR